ncbi:hypothetical protein tb265_48380 [Gemmatimonadetes bacterium T265]|nr:hypothetical protein tb265_48380 [Gemmatimonadetes bacterium T265]
MPTAYPSLLMENPRPAHRVSPLPVATLRPRATALRTVAGARRRLRPGALATLLAAAAACAPSPDALANGDDPLAALRSTAPSTRYNAGYWYEQAGADSAGRWRQATAYCGESQAPPGLEADGARPNCRAVWSAHFRHAQEQQVRDLNARVRAREAQQRGMTPGQRKAAFDSQLFKP